MSYIEGTSVRLWAEFTDPDTNEAATPGTVVLTLEKPDGSLVSMSSSTGEVTADPERPGRYVAVVDVDAVGTWRYQFETPDFGHRALARKELTVTARLGA